MMKYVIPKLQTNLLILELRTEKIRDQKIQTKYFIVCSQRDQRYMMLSKITLQTLQIKKNTQKDNNICTFIYISALCVVTSALLDVVILDECL